MRHWIQMYEHLNIKSVDKSVSSHWSAENYEIIVNNWIPLYKSHFVIQT